MTKSDYYEFKIDGQAPEFNQMALYLTRLDQRSSDRDHALNTGEVINFYRATMTLLMNCIPRFKQKNMSDPEIEQFKKDLMAIGAKVKGLRVIGAQGIQDKNKIQIEEDLFNYNIELNNLMFKHGLVFPDKNIKPLAEIIAEDY